MLVHADKADGRPHNRARSPLATTYPPPLVTGPLAYKVQRRLDEQINVHTHFLINNLGHSDTAICLLSEEPWYQLPPFSFAVLVLEYIDYIQLYIYAIQYTNHLNYCGAYTE